MLRTALPEAVPLSIYPCQLLIPSSEALLWVLLSTTVQCAPTRERALSEIAHLCNVSPRETGWCSHQIYLEIRQRPSFSKHRFLLTFIFPINALPLALCSYILTVRYRIRRLACLGSVLILLLFFNVCKPPREHLLVTQCVKWNKQINHSLFDMFILRIVVYAWGFHRFAKITRSQHRQLDQGLSQNMKRTLLETLPSHIKPDVNYIAVLFRCPKT